MLGKSPSTVSTFSIEVEKEREKRHLEMHTQPLLHSCTTRQHQWWWKKSRTFDHRKLLPSSIFLMEKNEVRGRIEGERNMESLFFHRFWCTLTTFYRYCTWCYYIGEKLLYCEHINFSDHIHMVLFKNFQLHCNNWLVIKDSSINPRLFGRLSISHISLLNFQFSTYKIFKVRPWRHF